MAAVAAVEDEALVDSALATMPVADVVDAAASAPVKPLYVPTPQFTQSLPPHAWPLSASHILLYL